MLSLDAKELGYSALIQANTPTLLAKHTEICTVCYNTARSSHTNLWLDIRFGLINFRTFPYEVVQSIQAKELIWGTGLRLLIFLPTTLIISTTCIHFRAVLRGWANGLVPNTATVQVIKAKTSEGFVPNTAASVNKARHSQPPVGSKVLLEMFTKYKDEWIVELLFDDLLDWNNWFHNNRRLTPLNLTCLGSEEGVMQDARFESGLE